VRHQHQEQRLVAREADAAHHYLLAVFDVQVRVDFKRPETWMRFFGPKLLP
jgi:hypothetical protein